MPSRSVYCEDQMKHFLVVASAIAALVTGCGQAAPGSSTHALVGTMTVNNSMGSLQIIGGPCTGKQGFEDIHGGTAVVVKDQSSTILATGSLSDGTAPDRFSCHFTFRVASVPD